MSVGLLIGVPITYSQFVSRVETSDWLAKFNDRELSQERRDHVLQQRWQQEYSVHVAEPLSSLVHSARSLGVDVRAEATIDMFRQATASHQIVILFAHWKGPEIVHDDFVASPTIDVSQFAGRVEACVTPICLWLRPRLALLTGHTQLGAKRRGRIATWFGSSRQPTSLREVLLAALSRSDNDDCVPADCVDAVLESEVTRASRRRDELDDLFHGLLKPGNRLELFDGLHSKEAVAASLPGHFDGVLDLTTCTSTVLADFVGRATENRVRTVQFPEVQQPLWAANCIQLAIRLLAEQGLAYQDARLLATSMMEVAVSQDARRH